MAVPGVDTKYQEEEIKRAREELEKLISEKKFRAADLLRLAYASQFTIANSPDTTPTATQSDTFKNLKAEIAKIKESHPTVTSPDLYQLAGTVAVEELGRPIIEFVPGRKDSSLSPDEGCLPDVKKSPSDLRGVFAKVGISDPKHIVALCGGLKLASSGVQDPTLKFDNSYFVNLDKKKTSSSTGNALLDDPDFYSFVKLYATDKDAFIKDHKEAHKNLSALGLPQSALEKNTSVVKNTESASEKSTSLWNNMVGQKGAGVAVAAVVVLLSVFYLIINKRRAKHSSQQFQ